MLKVVGNKSEKRLLDAPLLATSDDVRASVLYLKQRPSGVIVGDTPLLIFEERRVITYKLMGLVTLDHGRLKLSAAGLELARRLDGSVQAFRALLRSVEPYHAVLEQALRKSVFTLRMDDVIDQWLKLYPEICNVSNPKTNEQMAECFFQICQAAAIGFLRRDKEHLPITLHLECLELRDLTEDETQRFHIPVCDAKSIAPGLKEIDRHEQRLLSNSRNMALKVLSLALVREIEALAENDGWQEEQVIDFVEQVRRFETMLIRSALIYAGGRQSRAARLLKITRSNLNAKIKRYQIPTDSIKD